MRAVLNILSMLCYAAALSIAAAALVVPGAPPLPETPLPATEEHQEEPDPPPVKPLDELAGEQQATRALVRELRATIFQLQDEISREIDTGPPAEALQNRALEERFGRVGEIPVEGPARPVEQAEARPSPEEISFDRETSRLIAILGGGLFSPGQDVLTPSLRTAVERILPEIALNPGHRIIVEGHSDNKPMSPSLEQKYGDNTALSLLRAGAVADLLEEQGVMREQVTVVGHGSSYPLAPNSTPEGRAENRRVEVRLIPPAQNR